MVEVESLHVALAAAYVRGALPGLEPGLSDEALISRGQESGLKLHRFKRTIELPRVRAVLGVLRGLEPTSLLDIGTGRGVFLWPLLDAFPDLSVTAVEPDGHRRAHLETVSRGGFGRLVVVGEDACRLGFPDRSFDVVTALEVLEHQHDPSPMASEAVRLAERFVIASVPSKADDNPEHVRLFTRSSLDALLRSAGAANVRLDYVLNHIIAVARIDRE
jgi:ubiquinone/menaquinone biosynthesis C-methylase UbiE